IGLAFLGVPQLLVRFMAAGSDRDLVQGSGFAYLCIVIFDVGAVFTGIAGRALYPALEDQETVMPLLSAELFPAIFTGIFLVIVLGAIMSTVDSLLIMSSAAVVRDLVQKTFGSQTSERRLSFYGRLTTLAIGAIALPFALREAKVLFWFVLFAWSGLGAAFTPVVLCSLFWSRTTRMGAAAGMVSGFGVTVVWVQFFKAQFYDLYEMIPGFLAGLVATVVVSWMTEPPEGAGEELEAMRERLRYGG
ncbi:MAG: sodium/proline symporter, partial [Acidobacteriota bacterium]